MSRNGNQLTRTLFYMTLLCVSLAGCGSADVSVSGGTTGHLVSDGNPLAEFQITVHQRDADQVQMVGTAVTAADGSFALVTSGASQPLWLQSGEYLFTLESVGSPVQIPDAYQQVDQTPFRLSCNSGQELTLNIPGLRFP